MTYHLCSQIVTLYDLSPCVMQSHINTMQSQEHYNTMFSHRNTITLCVVTESQSHRVTRPIITRSRDILRPRSRCGPAVPVPKCHQCARWREHLDIYISTQICVQICRYIDNRQCTPSDGDTLFVAKQPSYLTVISRGSTQLALGTWVQWTTVCKGSRISRIDGCDVFSLLYKG